MKINFADYIFQANTDLLEELNIKRRRARKNPCLPEIVKNTLQSKANHLAQKHNLDTSRILSILEKTIVDPDVIESAYEKPLEEIDLEKAFIFLPSLFEALEYLPPEEALKLFENENINELKKKVICTNILLNGNNPLYTLEELERQTQSFIYHLEINQETLIKLGYPLGYFAWVPFLDRNMTNLYFVKKPAIINIHRVIPDNKMDKLIHWAQNNNKSYLIRHIEKAIFLVTYEWSQSSQHKFYKYKDGDFIEWVSQEDIQKIESLRGKLFRLKIGILKILLQAIRDRTTDSLWKKCLPLFTKELKADEVEFLMGTCCVYDSLCRCGQVSDFVPQEMVNDLYSKELEVVCGKVKKYTFFRLGGLSSLLYVILHYERELRIGPLHKIRETLKDFVKVNCLGVPFLPINSYFEIVNRQERNILDKAIEQRGSLQNKIRSFNDDFFHRVVKDFKDELNVEIVFSKKVKGKHADLYKTYMKAHSDIAINNLKHTNGLPSLSGSGHLPPTSITPDLTDEQKREKTKFDYKCEDRIHIPGAVEGRKNSNILFINGNKVLLPTRHFTLFLRFVLELKKGKGGWVNKNIIEKERINLDSNPFNIYYFLRREVQGALLDNNNPDMFIQSEAGTGNYRLSVHPDFVEYNKEKLLNHPETTIQKIAEKLP